MTEKFRINTDEENLAELKILNELDKQFYINSTEGCKSKI